MQGFIENQEKIQTPFGLSVLLIDFTKLQSQSGPQAASMITAIIERQDSQIFVKMTGSKQGMLNNLESFKSLLNSIKVNQ